VATEEESVPYRRVRAVLQAVSYVFRRHAGTVVTVAGTVTAAGGVLVAIGLVETANGPVAASRSTTDGCGLVESSSLLVLSSQSGSW
jgi:hypothetical protein